MGTIGNPRRSHGLTEGAMAAGLALVWAAPEQDKAAGSRKATRPDGREIATRLPRRFWWWKTKSSFACRLAIFFANADTAFWRRGPVKRRKRFSEVERRGASDFRKWRRGQPSLRRTTPSKAVLLRGAGGSLRTLVGGIRPAERIGAWVPWDQLCLQQAEQCERQAAEASLDSSREALLSAAATWRKLGASAQAVGEAQPTAAPEAE
jgi:hypothetical protein